MKRLPWSLWVVTVVLVVASSAVSIGRDHLSDVTLYAILPLSLGTVGALVASRQPGNAIGWLFGGLGLFIAAAELAEGYGFLADDERLPAGWVGPWVMSWSWVGEILGWVIIFLLFPNGRPPMRWSRWVLGTAVIGSVLAFPGLAFGPYLDGETGDANPLRFDSPVTSVPLVVVGLALLVAALVGSVASFVLRLLRARGVERVQLEWFAYAATLCALVAPIATLLWQVTPAVHVAPAVAFNALPVAAGIAILRHRLYDIDVVINRTLVYGSLTVTLAASYLGTVLVLQLVLEPLTVESDLAVAGSTLAVAALFGPARRQIQTAVDRRFYRSRYDATRTLEVFAGQLRHEVDLAAVGADLQAAVRETVQPTHVSLWIRSKGAPP